MRIQKSNGTMVRVKCAIFFSLFFVVACAGRPVEKYEDYFFPTVDDNGVKQFNFVLKLEGEGEQEDEFSLNKKGAPRNESKVPQRQSRNSKDVDFTSIAFRMEEEAFRRLERRVAQNSYCKSGFDVISQEYTWLRYTIKGACK